MTAPTCPFVAGQTYRTRDGREALIYCTDAPEPWPIHGRIDGRPGSQCWGSGGAFNANALQSLGDLLPPAPPRVRERVYVNLCVHGHTYYPDAAAAKSAWCADPKGRVAVPCELVEIVEEGT